MSSAGHCRVPSVKVVTGSGGCRQISVRAACGNRNGINRRTAVAVEIYGISLRRRGTALRDSQRPYFASVTEYNITASGRRCGIFRYRQRELGTAFRTVDPCRLSLKQYACVSAAQGDRNSFPTGCDRVRFRRALGDCHISCLRDFRPDQKQSQKQCAQRMKNNASLVCKPLHFLTLLSIFRASSVRGVGQALPTGNGLRFALRTNKKRLQ